MPRCNWPSSMPIWSRERPIRIPPSAPSSWTATAESSGSAAPSATGSAHAEVMALRRAGRLAAGGTAVVTLEPCNHHGNTPPCVDALIEAGVASVIYAVSDPNPTAAGGAARLAAAGVRRHRRCAVRSGHGRTAARMATPAAHRAAARDVEIRHQHRWPQRGRGRLEPVDHQRGRPGRRAPSARNRRRDRGGHWHGADR